MHKNYLGHLSVRATQVRHIAIYVRNSQSQTCSHAIIDGYHQGGEKLDTEP